MHLKSTSFAWMLVFFSAALAGQQPDASQPRSTTAADAVKANTSFVDDDGTAHVSRVVPIPRTISPQAQQSLKRQIPDQEPDMPLPRRREYVAAVTKALGLRWDAASAVEITEGSMGGVPVRIVTPKDAPAANRNKVLLNLHGGGFDSDSGSYTETIPIAGSTKIKVVAALYRLAPEHPFPAAVDDAVAVYRELLKSYKPEHIVIYGTSAGAILTGEVAVRLKQLKLPMPAALGIFSGLADFARNSDSLAIYTLTGFSGHLNTPDNKPHDSPYVGKADPQDPVLSPVYADLAGMPPTLFVTSERDLLLSGTINLHRAFLHAGADAQLVVFDGLPHAFWYNPALPESVEANQMMADFFVKHLGK